MLHNLEVYAFILMLYFLYSDLVYVEGSLRYNDYVDKDGNPRTKTEINQCKSRKNYDI